MGNRLLAYACPSKTHVYREDVSQRDLTLAPCESSTRRKAQQKDQEKELIYLCALFNIQFLANIRIIFI